MGADIGFHIEVRRKGKWLPVVWKLPEEIAGGYFEDKPVDGWVEIDAIISGRFYHFHNYLQSFATKSGLPDDISERFKRIYDEEHGTWGIGYFYLSDLNNYCQQVELNSIIQILSNRDNKLQNQLSRIESLLRNKSVPEVQLDVDSEGEGFQYQEKLDETFLLRQLRDEVHGITGDGLLDDSEIRLLYFAC